MTNKMFLAVCLVFSLTTSLSFAKDSVEYQAQILADQIIQARENQSRHNEVLDRAHEIVNERDAQSKGETSVFNLFKLEKKDADCTAESDRSSEYLRLVQKQQLKLRELKNLNDAANAQIEKLSRSNQILWNAKKSK